MLGIRSRTSQARSLAAALAIATALFLSGCGDGETHAPNRDTTAVAKAQPARSMARRFLRYSYEGAHLSSTHPLSDSVAALIQHPAPGEYVILVDTFSVGTASVRSDSVSVVSVTFPRALKVSLDWRTTDPEVDAERTLRVGPNRILEAPRIVGWPALRAHIVDVVADSGAAVATRIEERFRELAKAPGA